MPAKFTNRGNFTLGGRLRVGGMDNESGAAFDLNSKRLESTDDVKNKAGATFSDTGGAGVIMADKGSSGQIFNNLIFNKAEVSDGTIVECLFCQFDITITVLNTSGNLAAKAYNDTTIDYRLWITDLNYNNITNTPTTIHHVRQHNGTFTFGSNADNNYCEKLITDASATVTATTNVDYYTQEWDKKGTWNYSSPNNLGVIHDDGSTPYDFDPIDINEPIDFILDAGDAID